MFRKIKGSGESFNYSHFMGKMILSIELEVTVRARCRISLTLTLILFKWQYLGMNLKWSISKGWDSSHAAFAAQYTVDYAVSTDNKEN